MLITSRIIVGNIDQKGKPHDINIAVTSKVNSTNNDIIYLKYFIAGSINLLLT